MLIKIVGGILIAGTVLILFILLTTWRRRRSNPAAQDPVSPADTAASNPVPAARHSQSEYELQQSRFQDHRRRLEQRYFQIVSQSGLPRGLIWKSCDFSGDILWVIEKQSANLHALISTVIRFEAVPGGPMEEVEAVSNVRVATALFYYTGEQWDTRGDVLYNLDPAEVLTRHRKDYERYPAESDAAEPPEPLPTA